MSRWILVGSLLFFVLSPAAAWADEPFPAPVAEAGRVELAHDWWTDGAVTLGAAAGWVLLETALKEPLGPGSTCRVCDPIAMDLEVRNALRWQDPDQAELIGSITGFVLAPVAGLGMTALAATLDDEADNIWVDGLIVLESAMIVGVVTDVVKYSVARKRPAARFTGEEFDNIGTNLSFFSGHTSISFAFAVAAGTVASLREYDGAPWVWAVGLGIAGFTGYSRIAADAHYFSDVMSGALVGSAIAFVVPYLFHSPLEDGATLGVVPTPDGALTVLSWSW